MKTNVWRATLAAYSIVSFFPCMMAQEDYFVHTSVTNNQVLQRDFTTNTARVRLANGQEQILPLGGPHSVNGCQVWVGDVWVMAGQSNMRGFGYLDGTTSLEKVHTFASNESWTLQGDPLHRLNESPRPVHRELPDPTVQNPMLLTIRGASLGPAFADQYRQLLNVEVGLVTSAHGGVSMVNWSPSNLKSSNASHYENYTLYGAMLARIKKVGPVAGVLWYQGESDATDMTLAAAYSTRMRELVDAMRRDIRPDIPIVFAQIARTADVSANPHAWNLVREAQRNLNGIFPYMGGVATIDCDMDDRIHLSAQGLRTVGRRMAIVAKTIINDKLHAGEASPDVDQVTFESKTLIPGAVKYSLRVSFQHVNAWQNTDRVFGFSLRDDAGKEIPIIYSTRIDPHIPSIIIIYLTKDLDTIKSSNAVYLWYGYGSDPVCNLVTNEGLSLFAFGPRRV